MNKNILQSIDNSIILSNKFMWQCRRFYLLSLGESTLSETREYIKQILFDIKLQRINLYFIKRNYKYIVEDISMCSLMIYASDYISEYITTKKEEFDKYLTIKTLEYKRIYTNLTLDDEAILNQYYCESIDSIMTEIKTMLENNNKVKQKRI